MLAQTISGLTKEVQHQVIHLQLERGTRTNNANSSISPLDGASNDAKALADALIRHAGFPEDQIFPLATDQPPQRHPTRVEILLGLSNLRSAAPKDGLLLVAFAGHGYFLLALLAKSKQAALGHRYHTG